MTNPPVSLDCINAIKGLLDESPKTRVGAASFSSFTDHPYFSSIDFEALERKEIPPVFTPSSDRTNFDAAYDLEELLLEEAPLEARARKQKPRAELKPNATSQEIRAEELHRMIESLFEPFDYTSVEYDRYPGTIDGGTSSVGPPPEWVKSAEASSRREDDTLSTISDGPQMSTRKGQSPKERVNPTIGQPLRKVQTEWVSSKKDFLVPVTNLETSSRSRGPSPARSLARALSSTGGVQVVLDERGAWNELSKQPGAKPDDGGAGSSKKESGRMLGFLGKAKGRENRSRKSSRERGVLGKEGARQIVGE